MAASKTVFLFDVDNTLLDNDHVTADLKRHLASSVGPERAQRYRIDYPHDPNLLAVSYFLIDVERRYPAEHYVVVDDKLRILHDIKEIWGISSYHCVRAPGALCLRRGNNREVSAGGYQSLPDRESPRLRPQQAELWRRSPTCVVTIFCASS